MKKKIALHICNYAAPYKGNFINSLRSLELHENVENVYLFPPSATTSGAKVWITELNEERECAYIQENGTIDAFFQLKKIIKKHDVDVIVTHFSNLRADILVKLAFKNKKVIRFFHNTYRPRKKSVHMLRTLLWSKNIMVGVSEFVSSELRKLFSFNEIVTIINAIDFERLDSFDSISKDEKVVITMMGWDQKGKGVDIALAAVSKIRNKYDVRFNIVAAINGAALQQLINHVSRDDSSWIKILPPRHDIATYYNISDIFISASRAEAFGYSVVEAAYCRNSIIASRVDGQAELKIEGVYWFESEDVNGLCEKIEAAIVELRKRETEIQKEMVRCSIKDEYSLKKWSVAVGQLISRTAEK